MKDLPDKFQFRLSGEKFSGYTHSAKRNVHGDYEIKWARGWHKKIDQIDWVVATYEEAKGWIECGGWLIVDDKPKQKDGLPDEFYCTWCGEETVYTTKRHGNEFLLTWTWPANFHSPHIESKSWYDEQDLVNALKTGNMKILDKKPLTAEQQKQLKEFKEQVAQLEQSIKLNQQDICHKDRLVANYEQRKSDVLGKIAELEGK